MKVVTTAVDHAFIPRYNSNGQLVSVLFPLSKTKERTRNPPAVRIRQLPKERELLQAFCQYTEDNLDLKLPYFGDSFASLGDRFFRAVLVTRRPSPAAQLAKKLELYDAQGGLCTICRKYMGHRDDTEAYE